jgi:O-antigen/teichoic acid export membrane protein
MTLGPAMLFVAISYFFKEELIVVFFGPEFADAALPFFYLMITAVQASVFFWALPLIQSLGLANLRLKVYLSAIIVGAYIAFLLTPEWGPTGTAIGVLAANVYINLRFIYVGVRSISKIN